MFNKSFAGCKGNENRFPTVQSCVDTCGGQDPETDTKCLEVTCDVSNANFMKAKGCRPITKPGECCPSSWDCTIWNKQR